MRSRYYFLGASAVLVVACGQQEAGGPAASGSPSAGPSVAEPEPAAPAEARSGKPFAESFIQAELRDFPRQIAKLPKSSPDLPRNIDRERGPQYPFESLFGGGESLCGVGQSGSLKCFAGSLEGAQEITVRAASIGDGFAIAVGPGGEFAVTGKVPVALRSQPSGATPDAASDAGGDAGAADGPTVGRDERFRAVGAGGDHACAVEESGAVRCWSNAASCDLTPPEGVSATSVVVGSGCFACAAVEGGMRCWGAKAPVQEAKGAVSQLVAGRDFVCRLVGDEPTCNGREAPKSAKRLAAAGSRLCWIDAAGAIGCDKSAPAFKGKFVDLAITDKATCAADDTGFWMCDGAKIPDFEFWKAHPSWAPTAERRKTVKAARKALLEEFAARFKSLEAPVDFQADTKIDVGPFVETKYLPLLQNVGLDWPLESEKREYRYGAQVQGIKGGTYLLMIRDFRVELFAFDDAAELRGHTLVAERGPYDYTVSSSGELHFDEPVTHRDNVTEAFVTSALDARGILKVTGQRTRETREFEDVQKKDVFQCLVYEAKLTLDVAGKSIPKTPLGWKSKKNEIGNPKGCDAHWPLNVPFFIKDGSKRLGGPAWPKFDGKKALE